MVLSRVRCSLGGAARGHPGGDGADGRHAVAGARAAAGTGCVDSEVGRDYGRSGGRDAGRAGVRGAHGASRGRRHTSIRTRRGADVGHRICTRGGRCRLSRGRPAQAVDSRTPTQSDCASGGAGGLCALERHSARVGIVDRDRVGCAVGQSAVRGHPARHRVQGKLAGAVALQFVHHSGSAARRRSDYGSWHGESLVPPCADRHRASGYRTRLHDRVESRLARTGVSGLSGAARRRGRGRDVRSSRCDWRRTASHKPKIWCRSHSSLSRGWWRYTR